MGDRRRRVNGKLRRKTKHQKAIQNAIDKGLVPKPDTKEKLKQYGEAYFQEKLV